jgi:hypothetical protein
MLRKGERYGFGNSGSIRIRSGASLIFVSVGLVASAREPQGVFKANLPLEG